MGVEVVIEGPTGSFGRQAIREDVTPALPAGEISVPLGSSGTGTSVLLTPLAGRLRPERGHVRIEGHDLADRGENGLHELGRPFGAPFQDGAPFGSLTLYDDVALPPREHTEKSGTEIRRGVHRRRALSGLRAPRVRQGRCTYRCGGL